LTNLSVSLSGTDSSYFAITQPILKTLTDSNSSTTFTLSVIDDLLEATYFATVTIRADNMEDVTFNVYQAVTQPSWTRVIKITDGMKLYLTGELIESGSITRLYRNGDISSGEFIEDDSFTFLDGTIQVIEFIEGSDL
jgi:hypothetical protein